MKILSTEQVRAADEYTIQQGPISSIDLMEQASEAFVKAFEDLDLGERPVKVVCGTGNNAGDGMAIARLLFHKGYPVEVWALDWGSKGSKDFITNRNRWQELGTVIQISKAGQLPAIEEEDIVIDAIFGSGLNREIEGLAAGVVKKINQSSGFVISVDMPSGLFAERGGQQRHTIIKADHTLSFQIPKLAFYLPQNHNYVGDWQILDIGLSEDFLKQQVTSYHQIDDEILSSFAGRKYKFSHKGDFGHALMVAGSQGKIGAAVLASSAALRSGLGLLSVHIPQCGYQILQITTPEAMVQSDAHTDQISHIPVSDSISTIGIGPGLGMEKTTVKALRELLENTDSPMVLDADALNIISGNRELLEIVPPNSILTPHPKEFKRLAGDFRDDYHRLELQRDMALNFKLVVVVKGAHTAVALPDGTIYFNTTGNPGMATGGSGDVLTGVITGLLCRLKNPEAAAIIGVYVHGLAGDLAVEDKDQVALIASDLVDNLGGAFMALGLQL